MSRTPALLVVVVVATVLAVTILARRRGVALDKGDARAARPAKLAACTMLPVEWSWQNISVADSEAWRACFGKPIAPGSYTSPVFDQHVSRWCGCCYLVSVVQMIQDRLHLAVGLADARKPMFPCFSLNMQLALDTYNATERTDNKEWNACKGGMPTRVMNAIRARKCLLRLEREGEVWLGHPSSVEGLKRESKDSEIRIGTPQTLQNATTFIKRRIFKYGPVVLGINSKCLLHPNIVADGGLIDDGEWMLPDHALTVVGWKKVRDKECWIVRNSWGRRTVPAGRPDDPSCVGEGFNRCDTGDNEWIGDMYNPGYAYVPVDYKGIAGLPSPWFDAIPDSLARVLPPTEYDRKTAFDLEP